MRILILVLIAALCPASFIHAEDWRPKQAPLTTPWADDVRADAVLPEHPRPQLVRERWVNLNGLWDYAITPRDAGRPTAFDGRILVPFPVESALSGVMRPVHPDQRLWYRRSFAAPDLSAGERLLLHFGAVDWETDVFVNGVAVGSHAGAFDPFAFDVTDAVDAGQDEQQLVVRVWDPTDTASQPRGKQALAPEGIFYTAVTGIWQTVWLEVVPRAHVRSLQIVPDVAAEAVRITVDVAAASASAEVAVSVVRDGATIASGAGPVGKAVEIALPDARLWSPDDPFLYDLDIVLRDNDVIDRARSYIGMRSIAVGPDEHGVNRLLLNGEPLFQFGPLDQGWWPDGLYTAPTDAALRFDVETMKAAGFNMVRKHVKVEPARWYYWCDRLGILVWQDMPGGMAAGARDHVAPDQPTDAALPALARAQFRRELRSMIDALRNHPSIVVWVPFNEGWGQHDTNDVLAWVEQLDRTRLVDGPSGWADRGAGDMKDMHHYPRPNMFPLMEDRASVLGEFGGLGLPVENHLWQPDRNWGYRTYRKRDELEREYAQLVVELALLVRQGLTAAVYTQLTDVEGEVNGLLTYDRRVQKLDLDWLRELHAPLYTPARPLVFRPLLATSEAEPQTWQFTTRDPRDLWAAAEFDASAWQQGPAPFGTDGTPGVRINTRWATPEIWIRREFEITGAPPSEAYLRLIHDEDATVYVNGQRVADLAGYVTDYILIPLDPASLRMGRNTIAIHCRQSTGGQSIDAGVLASEHPAPK